MYELVPLHPTTDGYHNASGLMCEWSVLPGPMAVPWTPQLQPSSAATSPEPAGAHTIVLWAHFLADITRQLVSWVNPEVQVTNSDLYLAAACYTTHVWPIISTYASGPRCPSRTTRQASCSKGKCRLHQHCHQPTSYASKPFTNGYNVTYPATFFVIRVDNGISNCPYFSQDLPDSSLLVHMVDSYPQELPWRLLTPPSGLFSVISYTLQRKTLPRDSLIIDLPPPIGTR